MMVIIHFLNGNNLDTEKHYQQKYYRDDVIVEIDKLFYEVYFYVDGDLHYEITNDGFFSFPGMIVLDEISNEKIYKAIDKLIDYGYFNYFRGQKVLPVNGRFMNKWYLNLQNDNYYNDRSEYRLR